jgi:hypothetical protein
MMKTAKEQLIEMVGQEKAVKYIEMAKAILEHEVEIHSKVKEGVK